MNKLEHFKKVIKKDWYIQGFNGVPIFLNYAGWSSIAMKKEVGFGYSGMTLNYKNGYGEVGYLVEDFERIWKIIKNKTKKDPDYLFKQKKIYEKDLKEYENLKEIINPKNIAKISDKDLVGLFKKTCQAQYRAVGIAHMVESIGIEIEKDLKNILGKKIINKKEYNNYFSILTAPNKLSFLSQEEKELFEIMRKLSRKRSKLLKDHSKKYSWIQNSYAGPKNLSIKFFENKGKLLKMQNNDNAEKKKRLIKKLNLSAEALKVISIIDFVTIWQDERKANVLKAVENLGTVLKELSRRAKMPIQDLYYLGTADVEKISLIQDLKLLKKDLIKRKEGSFFLMEPYQELNITGAAYKNFIKYKSSLAKNEKENQTELHGTVANCGTAVGKVFICKTIDLLKKVEKGAILVASMTRPEFMPALKKAAAIITDEGGITSHAAIIARELNIPAVIGTKIATKILKDGMLVEVRANHGIVRIIKN